MERKNAWDKYDKKGLKKVMDFAEGYRKFISDCKTERESVDEIIRMAEADGFKNLDAVIKKGTKLKAGDKMNFFT